MYTILDAPITPTDVDSAPRKRTEPALRPRSRTGPLLLLATGAVTFVITASMAITPHLLPDRTPGEAGSGHETVPPTVRVAPPTQTDPSAPVAPPVPIESAPVPVEELAPADPPAVESPPVAPVAPVEQVEPDEPSWNQRCRSMKTTRSTRFPHRRPATSRRRRFCRRFLPSRSLGCGIGS